MVAHALAAYLGRLILGPYSLKT
uniref:Uncharacterized protein n=1 Tax=Arundo donax TaxID=35708 RepID=A0A0A9C3D0_ARUDO